MCNENSNNCDSAQKKNFNRIKKMFKFTSGSRQTTDDINYYESLGLKKIMEEE